MNVITEPRYFERQYYKEETAKKTIVLHHTAGGDSMEGVIKWFNSTSDRVAVQYLIDRKGNIYQPMLEKFWAHHLGVKQTNNVELNKQAVGIELSSWGQLLQHTDGLWYNYRGSTVPESEVCELPKAWRGFKHYHVYTAVQLKSAAALIKDIAKRNTISLSTAALGAGLCEVNANALKGAAGIWTHASYRVDKNDVSPQPAFLEMLKTLI